MNNTRISELGVYSKVRIGAQEKAWDSLEVYACFADCLESNRRHGNARVLAGLSHTRTHDLKRALQEDSGRQGCHSGTDTISSVVDRGA